MRKRLATRTWLTSGVSSQIALLNFLDRLRPVHHLLARHREARRHGVTPGISLGATVGKEPSRYSPKATVDASSANSDTSTCNMGKKCKRADPAHCTAAPSIDDIISLDRFFVGRRAYRPDSFALSFFCDFGLSFENQEGANLGSVFNEEVSAALRSTAVQLVCLARC